MRQLYLAAAMIISIVSYGQDTINPKAPATEFKRLLFGVNISPDYCYRALQNNDGSTTSSKIIELRNKNEEAKFGYTAGLNICYNISKYFGIEVGLQYSSKGYANSNGYSNLVFADQIAPRNGIVYPSNAVIILTPSKLIYHHNYLDIPMRAILSFGHKRFQFITSLGVTTNILLTATQTNITENANGSKQRNTNDQVFSFKVLNISPLISAGIGYRLNNKINIRIEPTLRYGILQIIDTPVTAYLWTTGLNMTCYYQLK
jgi:hypothetical protein